MEESLMIKVQRFHQEEDKKEEEKKEVETEEEEEEAETTTQKPKRRHHKVETILMHLTFQLFRRNLNAQSR